MNGILLINKPQEFTSFDVIAKLRGILKIKRLGHAGTLDPMATGCLPVFVGKATRACDMLPNVTKSYTAGFKLGLVTDTQDIWGKVTEEFDVAGISLERLKKAIQNFKGDIMQIPPMYSAVSIGGKKLYDLARQGIEVQRQPRKINISDISLKNFDEIDMSGTLDISCSKGTYIRTLINDIGETLGCGGTMTSLERTSSSGFLLKDSFTLSEVEQLVADGTIKDKIIPIDKAFELYPEVILTDVQTKMYKNGVKLDSNRVDIKTESNKYRVYGFDKEFLGTGLYIKEEQEFKVDKNFF